VSSKTKNLGLLKKDPILDKNDTFNIQTMLNDNWDKLDGAVGGGFQQAKAYTDEQISLVTATGIPKLVSYPLQVTATEDKQTTFEIPLDTFEVATDTLIVVINRAFLDASQYTVKGAVRDDAGSLVKRAELVLTKGIAEGSELSLLVMKNVPIGEDGAINGAVLAKGSVPIDRVSGLQDKVDEAFQAGNERKQQAVDALIALGVSASMSDSWDTIFLKHKTIKNAANVVIVEHSPSIIQSEQYYYYIDIDFPVGYTPIAWSASAVYLQFPSGNGNYYPEYTMKSAKDLTPNITCYGMYGRSVYITGSIRKVDNIYRATYTVRGESSHLGVDLNSGRISVVIFWTCVV
jgi:hypothetical protein